MASHEAQHVTDWRVPFPSIRVPGLAGSPSSGKKVHVVVGPRTHGDNTQGRADGAGRLDSKYLHTVIRNKRMVDSSHNLFRISTSTEHQTNLDLVSVVLVVFWAYVQDEIVK